MPETRTEDGDGHSSNGGELALGKGAVAHTGELEDAPRGYELFMRKQEGCEKVVLSA